MCMYECYVRMLCCVCNICTHVLCVYTPVILCMRVVYVGYVSNVCYVCVYVMYVCAHVCLVCKL